MNSNVIVSKTDERLIADVVLPGVPEEAISIAVRDTKWDDSDGASKGHDFTIKVRADRLPDSFAGNKYVTVKMTETFPVDVEFDLSKLHWTYKNGVVRISVPKFDWAIGKAVAKSADDFVTTAPSQG